MDVKQERRENENENENRISHERNQLDFTVILNNYSLANILKGKRKRKKNLKVKLEQFCVIKRVEKGQNPLFPFLVAFLGPSNKSLM